MAKTLAHAGPVVNSRPPVPVLPAGVEIRAMTAADWDAVIALWRASPGIELNESDTREGIAAFLGAEPGAERRRGRVTGVFERRDARGPRRTTRLSAPPRGNALPSPPRHRARPGGPRPRPPERSVVKCNVFLMEDNEEGASFWRHAGFGENFGVFQRVLIRR